MWWWNVERRDGEEGRGGQVGRESLEVVLFTLKMGRSGIFVGQNRTRGRVERLKVQVKLMLLEKLSQSQRLVRADLS